MMRSAVLAFILFMAGCSVSPRAERDRPASPPGDPDSSAGKAGKAAHAVAKESGKFAAKTGKALKHAGRDAAAGWRESSQEDKKR